MHIKAQTVIPAGTKITKCPPATGQGKSVWSLLRAEERKLEKQVEVKEQAEKVADMLKRGYTVAEAIKFLNIK